MFDIFKKKAPLLFTLNVKLEPYDNSVLNEGGQKFTLKKDGTALSGRKIAGKVYGPAWNYITHFGTADTLKRTDFNKFDVDVYGEIDRSNVFEDPNDRPYIYRCGKISWYPYMLPGTEYHCNLRKNGDDLDIYVAGSKIGTMEEKRDRVAKLTHMLEGGYQATAQIEPYLDSCGVFVIVRKV